MNKRVLTQPIRVLPIHILWENPDNQDIDSLVAYIKSYPICNMEISTLYLADTSSDEDGSVILIYPIAPLKEYWDKRRKNKDTICAREIFLDHEVKPNTQEMVEQWLIDINTGELWVKAQLYMGKDKIGHPEYLPFEQWERECMDNEDNEDDVEKDPYGHDDFTGE